jgi:hypothetical protein
MIPMEKSTLPKTATLWRPSLLPKMSQVYFQKLPPNEAIHSWRLPDFMTYILINYSVSDLANKNLRIEGCQASLQDLARIIGAEMARVEVVPGDHSEMRTFLNKAIESGKCLLNTDLANNMRPDLEWKGLAECKDMVGIQALSAGHYS